MSSTADPLTAQAHTRAMAGTAAEACATMLLFNAEMPTERLNIADTVKVQWDAYLGASSLLLSDMGRMLISVIKDDAGTNDAFCGASAAPSNAARYGDGDNHGEYPSPRDRLILRAAKHGLGVQDRPSVHDVVQGRAHLRRRPLRTTSSGWGQATSPRWAAGAPMSPGRPMVERARRTLSRLVVARCEILATREISHAVRRRQKRENDVKSSAAQGED